MRKQLKLKIKQAGLTSVEYAVAGGLLVVAIGTAIKVFGPMLETAFTKLLS